MYIVKLVTKNRVSGKVKTVETLLYTGECFKEAKIAEYNNTLSYRTVSAKRIDGNVVTTITENNVD